MEEQITISKQEYDELMNIKYKYHAVIGLNTIKLSGGTIYCRLCSQISKQDSILNKKLYDEIHFK